MNQALFINGEWHSGHGLLLHSENPCTGDIIWEANTATSEDVNAAIEAARNASSGWISADLEKRVAYLKEYQRILLSEKQTIANAISLETGKPDWEAATEAAALSTKIDISIEAYQQRSSNTIKENNGLRTAVRHKPHGVIAVFGPFNFPAHLPNGHIVPALLAGNTVVYKPSEQTPRVAEVIVRCFEKANFPRGVINLVQGEKQTGIALSNHPGIDGLFFTGSYATGSLLHRQFAEKMEKILALELGGNNPLIVHEIHNIDAAIYHTVQSAYITAGQRCTCARRLIIPDSEAAQHFIRRLDQIIGKIIVGPPNADPIPFMGPVISNQAADQLLTAQDRLLGLGGHIIRPLQRLYPGKPFLSPALIDVTDITNLPDEEYFGPILQLNRVKNFDSAIQKANQTKYGLAAGILTDNQNLWETFYRESRAGIVNWNRPLTGASSNAPFGGIGASGNHRPSAYYAADYSAFPVASLEENQLILPENFTPGITL